jgi:hypothetical protein
MDPIELASGAKDFLVGVLLILSLALAVIGWVSWRRTRIPRLLMVTVFFVSFLVEAVFLIVGLYLTGWIKVPGDFVYTFDIMLAVNVAGLMILYLALFGKRR